MSPATRSSVAANQSAEIIRVYWCPRCGNYQGSTNMGNLHEKPNIAPPEAKDAGAIRSYRSQCPNCKVNRIERYARLVPVSQVAAIKKKLVQKAKNGESAELTYSELVELERSER